MSVHMPPPLTLSNDLDLLNFLTTSPIQSSKARTGPGPGGSGKYKRREAPLDPLLLAAAISSGPHVTRHHYHHHHKVPITEEGLPDNSNPSSTSHSSHSRSNSNAGPGSSSTSTTTEFTKTKGMSTSTATEPAKPKYASQQAPRSQRLKAKARANADDSDKENRREPLGRSENIPRRPRGPSLLLQGAPNNAQFVRGDAPDGIVNSNSNNASNAAVIGAGPEPPAPFIFASSTPTLHRPVIRNLPPAPLQVQCMARTRIPTPHGPVFLHLYRNNKDAKEHLAIVADSAQLEANDVSTNSLDYKRFIRSASLDAQWSEDETELDRLTRGAYVGRLSSHTQNASIPPESTVTLPPTYSEAISSPTSPSTSTLPPLVRIHSECFTGETIGSMRCDCGEQLDEAIRLISQPASATSPGRGAVIYLRQEGRGIGLLSKIRAYNLQDMGHDTVQANLLLGHGADERRYDIAAAIMRDLGLEEVELLTNNPDKVKSLELEGVKVVKRREMVPRSWQQSSLTSTTTITNITSLIGQPHGHDHSGQDGHRIGGATLIGGGVTYGPELEKYLRTKVEKMGHMLDLPSEHS